MSNKPSPVSNNIIRFEKEPKSLGEVWLIDELNANISHSVNASITLSFDSDERENIDLTVVFFKVCRFEVSDFTYEADDIESEKGVERILPEIRGLYIVSQSDYLDETFLKYGKEYPDGEKPTLRHFMITTHNEVVNIVADYPAKLVFSDELIEIELNKAKET